MENTAHQQMFHYSGCLIVNYLTFQVEQAYYTERRRKKRENLTFSQRSEKCRKNGGGKRQQEVPAQLGRCTLQGFAVQKIQ